MLFTDIEGSTRLLRGLGGERYGEVLTEQRSIMRRAIDRFDGHEMGTEGDSFFVVFPSAFGAVMAAVEAQRCLATTQWPFGVSVRVRMGVETGEALRHEDSYMGIDVHRAARIAGAANGGQVVIGEAAQQELVDLLPAGVTLRDLGRHRLKDLPALEHLFQLVVDGTPDVTTPVKSLGAPSNLPQLPAPPVGRDDERSAAAEVLRSGARVVTLTGPGGVGKTTLALAVACDVEHDFADGVYFVDLAEARAPASAWTAIAATLVVSDDDSSERAVVEHLGGRRVLLVLDNLEQLDGGADVVRELVEQTSCTVLATSRGPLHLRVEHERVVAPLDTPEPGSAVPVERLATVPAVALFVREAQRARPSFALTAENASPVADICARLEGLPLAIELAAAQVRLLGVEALARSVEQRLDIASRESDRPDRQRTLAATIAWSVDLLSDDDRRSFERLGVFAGGADLDAVAAVLPGERSVGVALAAVEALADVSLVSIAEGVGGEPRVSMLGLVHDAAVAGLVTRGDADEVRRRHALHYLELAEHAEDRLRGPDSLTWSDRLALEQDNLREAYDWCMAAKAANVPDGRTLALRLATALGWYWYTHGNAAEGRSRIEAAIDDVSGLDPEIRANALHAFGVLEQQQGGNERAIEAFEASLDVWRALEDQRGVARELNSLGVARWARGEPHRALPLLEESAEVARRAGDESRVAAAKSNLAILDLTIGDVDGSIAALEEALEIDTRAGDGWAVAVDQCNLATAYACADRTADAGRLLAAALPAAVALGDSDLLAAGLEAGAVLAGARGDDERAAVLLAGSDALRRTAGIPRTPLDQSLLDRRLTSGLAALGEEGRERARARGRTLTIDELLREAAPSA
jgi:predicted ATPase/class 3 adenylate cyclase